MTKYCKVGRAVLMRAIGLQKNYTEIISNSREVVDTEASGCNQCKWFSYKQVLHPGDEMYASCEAACSSCPHKHMKTEYTYTRVYNNESNRYGYQPRLKTYAIKLFIAYHFMDKIDDFGLIRNVRVDELADILGCSVKTIHNNNELLSRYGYIAYSKIDSNTINVLLPEYENYYKPASAGGRGYITLSDAIFQELKNIDSLNVLRLTMRGLLEYETSGAGSSGMEKSYKELRRMLPAYCKRGIIQDASKKLSLFIADVKDTVINFVIKPEYNAKYIKKQQLTLYKKEIMDFSIDFTKEVSLINSGKYDAASSKYAGFFEDTYIASDGYTKWAITPEQAEDLASLCIQFSYDIVIKALQSIYKTYRSVKAPIKNIGGLARRLITSESAAFSAV